MNFSFEIMDWSIFIFFIGSLGFFALLIKIIIDKVIRGKNIKKVSIGGILFFLILSSVAFFELSGRDWSIPECRDQNGNLMLENQRCQFP
ncbi:hypothetical protein [Reinekea forsetii]|uniref:hypothetical protein n=1 Tax=Reinekea forsetii TaxID=1336806 RepID=UPI0011AE22E8|nr:hypothetical protein [Reinekea forsetii]